MGGANPIQQTPQSGTEIKGMIDPSGIQQDVSLMRAMPLKEEMPLRKYEKMEAEKMVEPNLSDDEKLQANYERIEKQGMSDQGIVSPEELDKELASLGSDLKQGVQTKLINPAMQKLAKMMGGSQNGLGRDATQGAFKGTSQTKASISDITEGLK